MMSALVFLVAQLHISRALPVFETSSRLDDYRQLTEPHLSIRAHNDVKFAPAWVPEPSTRGTFRLLYSCLFTLTLCVYTAIHLNVPKRRETGLELFWRKLKWVLVAIFAPELVLYAAYVQWHVASVMCSNLNDAAKGRKYQGDKLADYGDVSPWVEVKTKKHEEKYRRFSLLYGYYVVMGGLVLDGRDLHDEYSRVTITPEGLLYLASKGHFVDISDETIKDKSKSDAFAKIIVMLQVTWMIVQTCSRLAAGLPVTIIEGHTLIHVVTALAMYALWFKKPLNISEPTIVNHEAFVDRIALMLMWCTKLGGKASIPSPHNKRNQRNSSYLSIWKRLSIGLVRLIGLKEIANKMKEDAFGLRRLTLRPEDTSESAYLNNYLSEVREVKTAKEKTVLQRRETVPKKAESIPAGVFTETEGQFEAGEIIKDRTRPKPTATPREADKPVIIGSNPGHLPRLGAPSYEILLPDEKKRVTTIYSGQYLSCGIGPDIYFDILAIELSPKTVRRWEQAAKVLQRSQLGIPDAACYFIDGQPSNLPVPEKEGLDSFGDANIFWIVVVFFFLCTGYGGVHCVAWNSDFATHIEMVFWRVACIDLAVAGVLYFLLFAFHMAANEGHEQGPLSSTSKRIILVLGWGHFAVYLAARVFLVVEAFMSVRHLRVGAYEVVDWAAFIPHI
ncbi:hypothetical protein EDB81DRAFT_772004 [Dactylonectria macrodidyma]|uniref:Uncharacterized protein n=1 Tax=Dactylonectria macrodidyma TaxID=307937 RepID=A0A9P9FRX8_9HYPO|nr:hypothetical protein EDB81DRAFT_772004 [Dactylonectria macrodidyma]